MSKTDRDLHTHTTSTGHPVSSVNWLDTHFQAMQPEYEEMVHWVGIQSGWHVLDAGCGAGGYLPWLAELVGTGGKLAAVDIAPENVAAVEARGGQGQWGTAVKPRVASILQLPYADNTFDALWCANTIQYLTDDELHTALHEFRRVVRPGGLVAVKDVDGTSTQFQPAPATLMLHWYEANQRMGDIQFTRVLNGIQLPLWLRDAGLTEIRQRPTLFIRLQPLRPVEQQFAREFLRFLAARSPTLDLPSEEQAVWLALGDVNSPNHILNNPDFQYRAIQTVAVGRVPLVKNNLHMGQ